LQLQQQLQELERQEREQPVPVEAKIDGEEFEAALPRASSQQQARQRKTGTVSL